MVRGFNGRVPKVASTAFISETAYVVGDVEIGENSNIWPGAVIRGDFGKISIGKNTTIEDNSVLHAREDMIVGNHVIIGHGAVVHCREIGNNVLIGNNATVLDFAEIGNFCMIGAGSLVTIDMKIPDNSLVMGVPAHVKDQLTEEQVSQLRQGAASYRKLAQHYRDEGL
jgi:carbonic anhydrase/acetyltransferase-like protein (isoleucine patch superfamily)